MKTALPFSLLLVCFLLVAACSDDKPEVRTPTPAASETPPEATPLPTRTPPPGAITELPAMTVLIDVESGAVVTLHRDMRHHQSPGAQFLPDGNVGYSTFDNGRPVWVTADIEGRELSRETNPDALWPYKPLPGGCEVDGRLYSGVECGSISPNGRWMVYARDGHDLPITGHQYDLWVLDLQTDQRRLLQAGLVRCTQCDAAGRLEWSPGGDFLFIRSSGDGKTFLMNAPAGTSRDVTPDHDDFDSPAWSPAEDLLAYGGANATTHLEDVRTGSTWEVAVPWPARFEPTGRYLYSVDEDAHTTIAEVATGKQYARLEGISFSLGPPVTQPVVGSDSGPLSALGPTSSCKGTQIYAGVVPTFCVVGAGSPVISPDRRLVALARKTGDIGPVYAPTVEAIAVAEYEIIVVETGTGREKVLYRGATGLEFPPRMLWNDAGTHLLVWWSWSFGP